MKQKLTILCVLLSLVLKAQVFPVQVTPIMVPPYGVILSEYSNAFRDQLIVNLLLADISENRDVHLEFTLSSNTGLNVKSAPVVVGAIPFQLTGGIPLRLTNSDLQAYFQLENLVGITPQQYASPLPEGLYNFCFRVIDERSGQPISNTTCTQAFIRQNDPPFLNYPENGKSIEETNPTNIIFNWTPRHLNATNVEYEFTLSELWDENIDPQTAFITSPPLYQKTTKATTLLYGPTEPSLLPNKTYAWRVRAVVNDGISQTSVFKNNGYSEIWHFKHNGICNAPQFGLTVPKTATSQIIRWQYGEYNAYKVQYRKVGGASNDWFEERATSFEEAVTVYNLEKNTTYEYRIGGQCRAGEEFTYGNPQRFTTVTSTEEVGNYQCGALPDVNISNQDPLESLGINETFFAGDFPVTAKFVEPLGSGRFSGVGYVAVPYLADTRLLVKFENITLNTDKQLTNGIVETTYNPDWKNVDDISDELEALGEIGRQLLDLADAISEALNLDIDKVTRENTKAIANAIVENMGNEGLSEELQKDVEQAAETYKEAGAEVADAKEAIENAETKEEKKEAEKQLKEATKNYEAAQQNIEEVSKEVEKEKDAIADLLKKAIYEIYRDGKEKETIFQNSYNSYTDKYDYGKKETEDNTLIVFESGFMEDDQTEIVNNEFTSLEKEYSSYLFANMLKDADETLLNSFIDLSKKTGAEYGSIIKKAKDNKKTEKQIIEELKVKLKDTFVELLLQSKIAG